MTIAAAVLLTPEVPIEAVTPPESPAVLLGWKVVLVVPSEAVVPLEGVKLKEDDAG